MEEREGKQGLEGVSIEQEGIKVQELLKEKEMGW